MHWLIFLVVFSFHNEFASSWNSPHAEEVSCDSNSQCLPLSSKTASLKKSQETVPLREINTWYPIPKWKVFFGANKNRNEHSAPYFNKQDSGRADASIYDNDFSPTQFLKKPFEISERLNIQFFPVKDGVKKFERKINDNASEQVALFVIYAHSRSKGIARTRNNSDGEKVSEELVSELMKGNDNISITCDGSGVCMENITFVNMEKFQNTNTSGNETFSRTFEVVSIPVTKSMSIEMNVGELDENNYTAVIMPINGNFSSKDMKFEELVTTDENVIKIPLSKNMSIVLNSDAYENFTGGLMNKTGSASETVDLTTKIGLAQNNLLENRSVSGDEIFDTGVYRTYSTGNTLEETMYATNSYSEMLLDKDNKNFDENSLTSEIVEKNAEYITENLIFELENGTVLEYNSSFGVDNTTKNDNLYDEKLENTQRHVNSTTNSVISELHSYPIIYEYSKKFGPYEVKEINSSLLPFIATIHLTVKNKVKNNYTDYDKSLISKQNVSYIFRNNFRSGSLTDIDKSNSLNFTRTRRYVDNNENSTGWQKLFDGNEKDKITKQEIANNKSISNQNEISNNYQRGSQRFILNKAKEMPRILGRMKYYSSVLQDRNTKEEQSYSSRQESYSSATISNGNEEFNPKSTDKFGNKGLIANEISDNTLGADGTKSNQTASGDRNKREAAFPTLIPNKDSGENHSKKSELQIVERASFDKYTDLWKMKIPPEEQSLGRNSIKIGKICDLEDGCSGINDVFNAMKVTESGYYKEYQAGKKNFDRTSSSKVNEVIDKRIDFLSRNLMRELTGRATIPRTVRKRDESNLRMEKINSAKKIHENFEFANNRRLYNQVIPKIIYPAAHDTAINLKLDMGVGNDVKIKENENTKDDVMRSFETNLKSNTGDNEVDKRSSWNLFTIVSDTERFGRHNKGFQEMYLNDLRKYPFASRQKRSNLGMPAALHDRHEFYPTNPNESPHKMLPQAFHITNSSLSHIRTDELEWQNFLSNMVQMIPLNSITEPKSLNPVNSRPQNRIKEWLRRGSVWPQEKELTFQANDYSFRNKEMLGRNWIVIIPETVKPFTQTPTERILPHTLVNDRRMVTEITHGHSEREVEDDENAQWIAVGQTPPPKEPNKRKQNKTPSHSKENNPRKIVNTPAKKPHTVTTKKPCSPDQHWNFNQWVVSYDRWNPIVTTPMMMSGGMAGGD